MRHIQRLALGGAICWPERVGNRNLSEFRYRLPRIIALAVIGVSSLALWGLIAAVWVVVRAATS